MLVVRVIALFRNDNSSRQYFSVPNKYFLSCLCQKHIKCLEEFSCFYWEPLAQDHCIKIKKNRTRTYQSQERDRLQGFFLGENAAPPNARVFMMVTQVTITFCSELFKLLISPSLISHNAYINSPSSFLSCIHNYLDRE